MKIGGLLKFSLIDYPGKMAAVIFTQGCNFRCPYCHNAELVLPEHFQEPFNEGRVLQFLARRVHQLEGVVVTGGEPTIHNDLIDFLTKIKRMDYAIKLDTNGSNPDILKEAIDLKLVDYVAMDIKTSLEKYGELTVLKDISARISTSIDIILGSGLAHEFRTTVAHPVVPEDDLPKITSLIKDAQKYRLQRFIPRSTVLDQELADESRPNLSDEDIAELQQKWGIGLN